MIATVSAGVKPELFLRGKEGIFTNTCKKTKRAHLYVSIPLINPGDRSYCGTKYTVLISF